MNELKILHLRNKKNTDHPCSDQRSFALLHCIGSELKIID